MPGCSLPSDCGAECIIPGHFPVENQLNSFAPRFGIHRNGRGGSKVSDFARKIFSFHARVMRINSKLFRRAENTQRDVSAQCRAKSNKNRTLSATISNPLKGKKVEE